MGELGLTTEQAKEAASRGQSNARKNNSRRTVRQIVISNLFNYFNLIFAVLAVLLVIAGAYRSLTILVAVACNSLIGIFQQLRAKKILDRLSVLNQQTASVLRDGIEARIPVEELVLGDMVILRSGDQICADAKIVSGTIAVNESLLTGESDEVAKLEGDELLSGSFVVSGECLARLEHVGEDAYIAKLESHAKEMPGGEQSEMVRGINGFVMLAGIAVVPIGCLLFWQGLRQQVAFSENVTSMVAAIIGMIPEGLYLLVSVTLAASAAKLAGKKVMLHDMKSIETLARVDVLCVDKTGTITEPEMMAEESVLPYGKAEEERGKAEDILGSFLAAQKEENATMVALRKRFPVIRERKAEKTFPFSSRHKYSAASFEGETYVLGAPDVLLAGDADPVLQELLDAGERVLVFGEAEGGLADTGLAGNRISPILFLLLRNPIRNGAAQTFAYFANQGVRICVISGDHPMTVSKIAKTAGIPGADKAVDASTLKTGDDMLRAVSGHVVFARVTPEQKKELVHAFQKDGHTVAMVGDGVNDIMAMKAADCSVAMASGSDAAVQSAQVALLDSDFSHMPQIVAEGRRIIGNIERSATLFLSKNMFSMMLSVFSIIHMLAYPLQPEQVSLVSGFNIGIPAFFLAMEPNEKRITGRFMSKVLWRAMPAAVTDFVAVAALMVFGDEFGVPDADISVAATFLLAIVGFIVLYSISRPLTKYRGIVLSVCVAGFLCNAYFLHNWFAISRISKKGFMLLAVFGIATEPCMRYLTMLCSWLEKLFGALFKHKGKERKHHAKDEKG